MIFSEQELMCFNSILDGIPILGVPLHKPLSSEEDDYVKATVKTLQKKGLVNEGGRLTKAGAVPVMALEAYKKAKRHLFLNRVHVSFNDDQRITVLRKEENGYDLRRMNREFLFINILKQFERLRDAQPNQATPPQWKKSAVPARAEQLDKIPADDLLLLREVIDGHLSDSYVYYWSHGEGYVYNLNKEEARPLGARDMRMEMAAYFALEEGR
jgi:hypothetical protein